MTGSRRGVAVSGAGGRMGRMVCATVVAANDLDLVAVYDPAVAGAVIEGLTMSAEPSVAADAAVIVEFTRPDVVMGNLAVWRETGADVVVGTSGFDAERIAQVATTWEGAGTRCLIVPNFSIGAVVMMRLAEIAAPHFAAAEIIELHHDAKVDAPSGTAIATAARMTAAGGHQDRAADSEEVVPGARGGSSDGVRIHSVRLPGMLAHQEVLLGNPGETLTIRHDSSDRSSFMPGVLAAIRGIADLPPGVTVGLEPIVMGSE